MSYGDCQVLKNNASEFSPNLLIDKIGLIFFVLGRVFHSKALFAQQRQAQKKQREQNANACVAPTNERADDKNGRGGKGGENNKRDL